MKPEDMKKILIDRRYRFVLTDGRTIEKRGSWLLGTADGHWCLDQQKAALVASFTEV